MLLKVKEYVVFVNVVK